jgi:hypothetical protein
MKLVRFGAFGHERPGVMANGSDVVLDASPVTTDYDVAFFEVNDLVACTRQSHGVGGEEIFTMTHADD